MPERPTKARHRPSHSRCRRSGRSSRGLSPRCAGSGPCSALRRSSANRAACSGCGRRRASSARRRRRFLSCIDNRTWQTQTASAPLGTRARCRGRFAGSPRRGRWRAARAWHCCRQWHMRDGSRRCSSCSPWSWPDRRGSPSRAYCAPSAAARRRGWGRPSQSYRPG